MNAGYNLFLDDERESVDPMQYTGNSVYVDEYWEVVRNYEEFVDYVKNKGIPKIVSFDHDLAREHYKYVQATTIPYKTIKIKTGYHCLLWFLMYCKSKNAKLPEILIHTMNDTGIDNMENLIAVYETVNGEL